MSLLSRTLARTKLPCQQQTTLESCTAGTTPWAARRRSAETLASTMPGASGVRSSGISGGFLELPTCRFTSIPGQHSKRTLSLNLSLCPLWHCKFQVLYGMLSQGCAACGSLAGPKRAKHVLYLTWPSRTFAARGLTAPTGPVFGPVSDHLPRRGWHRHCPFGAGDELRPSSCCEHC